ncbi:MAG: histone deacetylase, partial [Thiotrichales bacterium]|nr:histone deacetylase [Thiotrichales bacterium]
MENIRVYSHSACLSKENGDGHPERKERLESILDSIKSLDTLDIDFKEAPLAEYSDINHVHPQSYLEEIFEMIPNEGLVGVEKEPYADTILCQNSKEAILRACGAGISASRDLMEGNLKRLFCAVRPPGHHAETARVNGFCFINNVAVAARYLQSQYDIKRVAIIDFDVHHGNGTQEIFYNDESVLYGSIHQHPLFPGTGL